MNNWKVIFSTMVIFGSGVITGGGLVNYFHHPHPNKAARKVAAETHMPATNRVVNQTTNQMAQVPDNARPHPPEILSKQFLHRLDGDLRLTPEQHEAIQKIIGDGQNLMRKVVQDARLEIREVLTPEQCKAFDELIKRAFRKPIFGTNAAALTTTTNAPATNPPAK